MRHSAPTTTTSFSPIRSDKKEDACWRQDMVRISADIVETLVGEVAK